MIPRWMTQLPGLRVYAALEKSDKSLVAAKEQLKQARADLEAARARADLAGGTLAGLSSALGPNQAPVASATRLDDILRTSVTAYRSAKPFPHIVIENLVEPAVLEKVLAEFSASDRKTWHHTENSRERKYSTEDEQQFGPYTRAVIHVFNSGPFLSFLEALTGIDGLMADPHLRGGGLHEIKRGGALGVHADFNFYKRLKVYRRLNLIVYLNKDWKDEWGGHLELWEKGAERPAARVAPAFNRAVIFDTSNSSYHGHPHPLACPEDQSRKSVALYYYSVDYPYEDDRAPHITQFIDTPDHDHEH
jgi:Rps23 Pro-64 3,4-dihydroxylase Tpa1-like proline 4-hydroxylase